MGETTLREGSAAAAPEVAAEGEVEEGRDATGSVAAASVPWDAALAVAFGEGVFCTCCDGEVGCACCCRSSICAACDCCSLRKCRYVRIVSIISRGFFAFLPKMRFERRPRASSIFPVSSTANDIDEVDTGGTAHTPLTHSQHERTDGREGVER